MRYINTLVTYTKAVWVQKRLILWQFLQIISLSNSNSICGANTVTILTGCSPVSCLSVTDETCHCSTSYVKSCSPAQYVSAMPMEMCLAGAWKQLWWCMSCVQSPGDSSRRTDQQWQKLGSHTRWVGMGRGLPLFWNLWNLEMLGNSAKVREKAQSQGKVRDFVWSEKFGCGSSAYNFPLLYSHCDSFFVL